MGGKNAIIIDDDADLDEAVKGVVYSAFGFQGQKCSACSRVIIVGGNYDRIVERLTEAAESLLIAPPSAAHAFVGPVIDRVAFDRISATITAAKKECTLLTRTDLPAGLGDGYYIPPTIFAGIPKGHSILRKEIFGPVLAITSAETFDEALVQALDSEYGLTGGVFSRSPGHIAKAVSAFNVGNLYINRSCTGALVCRQPFGGARMSGMGSKAGGPDYLLQFLIPRAVTENTMRRGFVPDL
jgi:RHH-type proline utilization regulon transcriptional repressor/proline dehydrogenase/delta 1-pyrroline-5-carboxylate dehydrogenase